MAVPMKVAGLTVDPFSNMPIVILKDSEEKLTLPIWIGLLEASAIATELEKVQLARPMTHDLLKNVLDTLGVTTMKVVVSDLRDNTFYAELHLAKPEGSVVVDSRPSDAIALALRTHAPIFVEEHVLEKSKGEQSEQRARAGEEQEGKWRELLERLKPEDFGKYKM